MAGFIDRCVRWCVCAASIVAANGYANAQDSSRIEKREPTKFIRLQRDEFKNPQALQTATTKYVLKDEQGKVKLEVYLESVVHIGDQAYYKSFASRFEHYDAILYELVAPPEKTKPSKEGPTHPLRLIQQIAADGLGFAHQLDEVDYESETMIHSDLSPKEIAEAMRKRGDDEITMMADMMLHAIRQANRSVAASVAETDEPPTAVDVMDMSVLMKPNGGVLIRRALAESLVEATTSDQPLPASQMATLIKARNTRALKKFQEQLDEGKRKIAFFWGAGHMPDLEQRLILQYGMELEGVYWKNAWDLRDGAVKTAPLETVLEKTLRGSLEQTLRDLLKGLEGEGEAEDDDGGQTDQ